MSIKKLYKTVAIIATVILIIIGIMMIFSTLFFSTIPLRSAESSFVYTDGSPNIHSFYFNQEHTNQQNNSSEELLYSSPSISSFYITLDPVRDFKTGDQIIISGITNAQPGNVIDLKITPVFPGRTDDFNTKTTFKSFVGLMGSIKIPDDEKPVHHWSWIANSSELSPNVYEVTVSFRSSFLVQNQIPGVEFSETSRFTLTKPST